MYPKAPGPKIRSESVSCTMQWDFHCILNRKTANSAEFRFTIQNQRSSSSSTSTVIRSCTGTGTVKNPGHWGTEIVRHDVRSGRELLLAGTYVPVGTLRKSGQCGVGGRTEARRRGVDRMHLMVDCLDAVGSAGALPLVGGLEVFTKKGSILRIPPKKESYRRIDVSSYRRIVVSSYRRRTVHMRHR